MIKLTAAIALLLATARPAPAMTLSEAHEAYDRNEVAAAKRIYSAIAGASDASASDRAEADIELARIAWLIDGNAAAALQRLTEAEAMGAKGCEVAQMAARVLHESRRDRELQAAEPRLLRACSQRIKADSIRIRAMSSRLDRAVAAPARRAELLRQAMADAALLSEDAGGEGARVRLETALLRRDARAALAAWKDYYWLTTADAPPALIRCHPAVLFRNGLSAMGSDADRLALADLLMRAGFAEGLERFVATFPSSRGGDKAKWKLVRTYLDQRRSLTAYLLQLNRALARGGSKDETPLKQAAFRTLGALMSAAGARGDPRAAIREHYGLIGSVGLTSGYPSMHIGHLVEDRTETVRQYGHDAKIHFVVIDNMWANGFESWLWDGSAETGGWSGDNMIVQVRSAYTSAPLSAFELVGDRRARRQFLTNIAEWSKEDIQNARSGTPATLRGVNGRLRLQIVDQIAAAARRAAGTGDFRRAFLDEYWRANNQQSVFVHEGRHAIDKAMAADPSKLDDTTLEYQANLSELALSDYPRMALWNLNHGIGGSSPHEQASTRIIGHLTKWVEAHGGAVTGYDPAFPAAVQIDKLSDGQIREIARSLDPLATASAGNPSGTSTR